MWLLHSRLKVHRIGRKTWTGICMAMQIAPGDELFHDTSYVVVSFVVMSSMGLRKALTADHHLTQAGFEVLLTHES
jgi:hypothetical protein